MTNRYLWFRDKWAAVCDKQAQPHGYQGHGEGELAAFDRSRSRQVEPLMKKGVMRLLSQNRGEILL